MVRGPGLSGVFRHHPSNVINSPVVLLRFAIAWCCCDRVMAVQDQKDVALNNKAPQASSLCNCVYSALLIKVYSFCFDLSCFPVARKMNLDGFFPPVSIPFLPSVHTFRHIQCNFIPYFLFIPLFSMVGASASNPNPLEEQESISDS